MIGQKLFRAVSIGEVNDWQSTGLFKVAKNTLEAKQFFKTWKLLMILYANLNYRVLPHHMF